MSREIMQLALDALDNHNGNYALTKQECADINKVCDNLRQELAKPEPIYVMGNYAGEGKVVNASFGLPKGAFEFAPYTGAGEASKIKHSLEPVGWFLKDHLETYMESYKDIEGAIPLYTAPPRKEWVGLSINEGRDFFESKLTRAELITEINEFLEEKNT
jgi:hypothetical protein